MRLRYRACPGPPCREGEDLAFPYRKALGVGCIRITQGPGKNTDWLLHEPRPLYLSSALLNQELQNPCLLGERREVTDEKSW